MSARARPGSGGLAPLARLPGPTSSVLAAAARIVAARPQVDIEPSRMLGTAAGIRQLLDLLVRSTGLRAATASQAGVRALALPPAEPATGPGSVAAALLGADQGRAEWAAAVVRGWLADGGPALAPASALPPAGARDADRRAAKPTAEQRAERRRQARVEELRAARDKARRRATAYQNEAAEARERVAALEAEVAALSEDIATLTMRLSAMTARARQAEVLGADPLLLADALAELMLRQTGSESDDQGGGLAERLRVAARQAALPEPVQRAVCSWLPGLLAALARPPRAEVGAERELTVRVLGGGVEIGGSCVLVSAAGVRVLVDAGARVGGMDAASLAPPDIGLALAEPIDAIFLTHAHHDHAGWVPAVLARQPDVPVYATEATVDLLPTMWSDSARVMARRADRGDSWSGPPPYREADVRRAVARLRVLPCGRGQRVGDLRVELFPAGHIVGAAGVVLRAGDRRVVVSGDVSGPGQASVGGLLVPPAARDADLLLLESTYARQNRPPPRELVVAEFVRDVAATLDAGGRVLVPAFALGRAQEIALMLGERLPDAPVLVDGLAREVSEVYQRHAGPDGSPLRIFGGNVTPVEPRRRAEAIERLRGGVVIATSGMLTSGPAVAWAERVLPDPSSALLVVGYQDEDSPGGRLLELAERGGGELDLPDGAGGARAVRVAARVRKHHLGAHASADELTAIAADIRARQVMLVHGDPEGQRRFAERLALRDQDTVSARRRWTPPDPD